MNLYGLSYLPGKFVAVRQFEAVGIFDQNDCCQEGKNGTALEEIKLKFEPDDQKLVTEFLIRWEEKQGRFFNRNGGNRKTAMRFFEEAPQNTVYFLAEHQKKNGGVRFPLGYGYGDSLAGDCGERRLQGDASGQEADGLCRGLCEAGGKRGILLTNLCRQFQAQALYERSGYCQMGRHTSGELLYLLRF